jgi:hypothetical protein
MLMMILGTAAAEEMRGSLDQITRIILGSDDLGPAWRNIGTSLDSPVLWVEKEDLEDEDATGQERIKVAAEERRAACEAAYREAGVPVPTTIRELAETMVALGIASQDEDGTWWMPEDLPLPEKVLSLPEDMAARFREYRRVQALEPAEQAIIHHLSKELGHPDEVFTSLDRLAEVTEMTVDEVRPALDYLVEQGDARLYRGDPRSEVAAKDLPGHARFYLVPDWEHFAEHRIEVRHDRREGDED